METRYVVIRITENVTFAEAHHLQANDYNSGSFVFGEEDSAWSTSSHQQACDVLGRVERKFAPEENISFVVEIEG